MSLARKYSREIKAWDWPAIVADAKANQEPDMDNPGQTVGYCYLGSVFSLTPSGKYYLPFACSNVEPCPTCGGSGETRKLYSCQYCRGRGWRTVEAFMNPGTNSMLVDNDGKPLEVGDTFTCNVCNGKRKVPHSCNTCQGVGSLEAYRDEVWQEQLEAIAEQHGGFVTAGEGDPCDVMFGISGDVDETVRLSCSG